MAADKAEGVSNPVPPYRRLQIFSLDPAVDIELDKALISRSVIQVPWENLSPGPVGEYLEVIDVDPASNCIYDPIDLSGTLAVDGRDPSTGNPQFHQQMVYAVAALTINNFERILGRRVLWAERYWDENGEHLDSFDPRRFVQRLRIYPHALRDQNAYYSPAKKALAGERGRDFFLPVRLLQCTRGGSPPGTARRHGLHLPLPRYHCA